jgi:hypothetical protein
MRIHKFFDTSAEQKFLLLNILIKVNIIKEQVSQHRIQCLL